METIIDIIKNQKPMEVPKVLQQYPNGSAPGKGFGINNGEAYTGKIGKTIFTNGRGIKQYNKQEVYYINNFPCLIHSIHYDYLMRISVINNDLQLSEKYAVKIGDSIEISNNLHNAYKEAYWESLKTKDVTIGAFFKIFDLFATSFRISTRSSSSIVNCFSGY